jgi:transcriptional regulator NrdR family protein
MFCPKCGEDTKVLSSVFGNFRERVRKCEICGYVFNTIEVVKTDPFLVEYLKEIINTEDKLKKMVK